MWSELKGFILNPLIFPNSATADWRRGFRPPPSPNHSAIEAAESGRPTDDEHENDRDFKRIRGVGLTGILNKANGTLTSEYLPSQQFFIAHSSRAQNSYYIICLNYLATLRLSEIELQPVPLITVTLNF